LFEKLLSLILVPMLIKRWTFFEPAHSDPFQ